MRWFLINLKEGIILLAGLVILSSCTLYLEDNSLVGKSYVNETTLDKIEFTGKGMIFFTWTSDNYFTDIFDNDDVHSSDKNYTHEFYYQILNNSNIRVILPSTCVVYFPYKTLNFSDSKDEIYFTDVKGESGVFKKQENK